MPNRIVYVDYWMRSACYPRGNFYPLAISLSNEDIGSLNPAFASVRLVGLTVKHAYAFTRRGPISIRAKHTFERLRFNLGGNRPS